MTLLGWFGMWSANQPSGYTSGQGGAPWYAMQKEWLTGTTQEVHAKRHSFSPAFMKNHGQQTKTDVP
jgi:hypothetical protein